MRFKARTDNSDANSRTRIEVSRSRSRVRSRCSPGVSFKVPDLEQLEEGGLSEFFHESEWIGEIDIDEADEILEIDRALTELIASHLVGREEFELDASSA